MNRLKNYIFKTISQTFFPIFFTLFAITSIIYLVKIASLTSVIQVSFLEFLYLYGFTIPLILFYTLPISIVVSLAIAISKLSSEYELIVITSFGLNPIKILKILFPTTLFMSLFLLVNNFAVLPKADFMNRTFLNDKKNEAQFNIKASEYGQSFGNWLIYVSDEKKGIYKDIVLYKKELKKESFILAKSATILNHDGILTLQLNDGKTFELNDKNELNQIDFEKMYINNKLKQGSSINSFDDLIEYWKDFQTDEGKRRKFIFYLLLALFPLVSLFFIISMGYFNPRYDKNRTTLYVLVLSSVYVLVSNKFSKSETFLILYLLPAIWVLLGYLYYRFTIKKYY